jgi:hypothetical protein
MYSIMKYTNPNFITFEEFRTLISSDFSHQRANIIVKYLKNIFIYQSDDMYVLQDNITYKVCSVNKSLLFSTITDLLEKSYYKLSPENQNDIIRDPRYKYINKKKHVGEYLDELLEKLLAEDDVYFNNTISQIHFRNGYMDLNDLQFKNREIGKHFITNYINRDYKQSTKRQQEKILNHIGKIYPNELDRECILKYFGSALSGISNKEQDTLFLLGLGSSGKSFILSLTDACIGCYFKELKSDTFTFNNSKVDKIMNTFQKNPQVRISWINEMEDARIDSSLFKKFCDGQLTTCKLYKEGSFTIPHYSKAIITANTMPNIKVDTGVSRRFRGFTHQSNFTDDKTLVNHEKHIYEKDTSLLESIIKENLLDAWFDILSVKCNEWLNGSKIVFTKNFEETRDTVMLSNDWIQDFIDTNLKITNNPDHRIAKNEMILALKEQFPTKYVSPTQLISALKDKKIEYNAKFRCEKLQGCFVGVCFQDEDESQNNYEYKIKYEKALETIQSLERQIQELKMKKDEVMLPVQTPKKIKMKKEESSAVSLDDIVELMDVF